MKCQEVKNNLSAHLDSELDPKLTREIEVHLKACPSCLQESQQLSHAWALLDAAPQIEPSPDYISRFWTKVASQESAYERFTRGFRGLLGSRPVIPIVTVLSLMLIIGSTGIIGQINMLYQYSQIKPEDAEMLQHLDIAEHFQTIKDFQVIEGLDSPRQSGDA